mmetsp:Transcript_145378/g.279022  ORF Transcript_145378/g.279022 Transcript_145378/m.279022 type:complete len:679 (-) Transcript_145378:39-2075(-)
MSDDEMDLDDMGDFRPPPPLPDGITKEVVKEAETANWKNPKTGDEIKVHYVGTLPDGTEFDSSRSRGEPITFVLGKGTVIKGWDLGIAHMKKGEIAKLTIAPEYAYGEPGQPPTIPPNATLIFEVEVISWISNDDLFGDEGAFKTIEQEGDDFRNPKNNEEVRMNFRVVAADGSTVEDRPGLEYVVGSEALGPASKIVNKVLKTMKKQEKCRVKCSKDYVYPGMAVTMHFDLEQIYDTADVSFLKDSSVWKKVIQEGESYETPKDSVRTVVRVNLVTDGTNPLPGFSGPKELTLFCGNGDVCDALESAVREMKKGERALVTCTVPVKCLEPRLGLSEVMADKVVFDLEMLDFDKDKEMWAMSNEEKVGLGMLRKQMGGELFKSKRFELALEKYNKCMEIINQADSKKDRPELAARGAQLKQLALLNKAACYLQLNDPTNALSTCNMVLKEDRNNVKALFRRAKAHFSRGEHADALRDLERVIELDPENTEAKSLVPQVRRAQKVADKETMGTYAKMCAGLGKLGRGKENQKPAKEEVKEEAPKEPERPKDLVAVSFKIDKKLQPGETICVVGASDVLGEWDNARGIPMIRGRAPPDYEAMALGKPPKETNPWELTVDMSQDLGRTEYKYLIRSPAGDSLEKGSKHVLQLGGMGGSRCRCADEWREEPDWRDEAQEDDA